MEQTQTQEPEFETVIHEVLNAKERESKRLANKPYIDHLDDAVVTDAVGRRVLKQGTGMRIIIERVASVLADSPWLDTRSYIILKIDEITGDLRLWDEDAEHFARSNFITATELGYRFKIPPRKGAPLPTRNKTEPKVKLDETPKVKVEPGKKDTERRIYSSRGIIHTRIKGIAYVPQGETKAADSMRLMTILVGTNLKITFADGTEEMWVPNKDL